jgi:alkane 1-monooxygenase
MTAATATTPWTDGKRYLWLLSPMVPVLVLTAVWMYQSTGHALWAWGGPILLYGIIPVLDWLVGTDPHNAPESAVARLEGDPWYRAIVYAYVPIQYLATAWGAWLVATHDIPLLHLLGLVFTVGTVNGIGINTAHELGHKKAALERWLAKITLAPVAYGHFYVEHTRGHHRNVATPDDPASSRMGESFWAFLPRTMLGSLKSAWAIEKERLARAGKGAWNPDNDNLQAWAMTVALFGALTLWLGWAALPFLLAQAFYGASLLEVVNYLEHYGLLRQKGPDGRYERCKPEHSWNSNNIVTNLFLYQLQRHSDHHANPTRRFQALRHFDHSPQLPTGYAALVLIAYFPPLWFRQMDPRVVAHYRGDLTRANLHPPRREALLRRWGGKVPGDGGPDLFPGERGAVPRAASGGGRYRCTDCGYVYDEALGCPHEGFAPGTTWAQIPDDWACPDCAVREKPDFVPVAEAAAPRAKAA